MAVVGLTQWPRSQPVSAEVFASSPRGRAYPRLPSYLCKLNPEMVVTQPQPLRQWYHTRARVKQDFAVKDWWVNISDFVGCMFSAATHQFCCGHRKEVMDHTQQRTMFQRNFIYRSRWQTCMLTPEDRGSKALERLWFYEDPSLNSYSVSIQNGIMREETFVYSLNYKVYKSLCYISLSFP